MQTIFSCLEFAKDKGLCLSMMKGKICPVLNCPLTMGAKIKWGQILACIQQY